MKVPAVTIDITDDGRAYTITATPWPTIDGTGHPYTARLTHTVPDRFGNFQARWNANKLAAFVKKLMASYPKVTM